MKNLIHTLYEQYKSHHEINKSFLEWVGVIGFFAWPGFYLLRRTGALPPLFDDFELRIIASFLCLLVGLRRWWPARLKPFYIAYSYFTVLYCTSFLLPFSVLMNQGSTPAIVNMVIGIVLVNLLTDWRNTIVMLLIGYGFSLAIFCGISPDPKIPTELLIWLPGCILIILSGSLFKHGEKQAEEQLRLALTALAGSIAHEMRNPLGQVKYSLDSIEHTLPTPSSSSADQPLSAQKLNTLYRQLALGQIAIKRGLQVITMTLNEVNAKSIDPASFEYLKAGIVTQKAIEEYGFDTEGERKKVTVTVLQDFTFKVNETLYSLVLFNLIKNALYYFKLHPEARLTITISPSVVKVKDTGPGMSEETLSELFQAFKTSGKSGGTGLGLAYCKRAMQAFGGEITCNSVLGEYTEFSLRFPAISQTELTEYEASFLQQASKVFAGKRILIVDDQALLRQSARLLLKDLKIEIEEAQDGQQALEKLQQGAYDLILMDLNMPVLDGYATAEKIRSGAVCSQQTIPIVAYTSESAYMAQVKTQKVGMNGFVSKPCSQIELVEALQEALLQKAETSTLEPNAENILAGKTVLVADDEEQNRKILQSYLQRWNVQVIEAEHGMDVLEILRLGTAVDAILMDMQMPGMDGLQTTRAIRQDNVSSRIPIIAITANFSVQHRKMASEAGMNDFISKPVEAEELKDKLLEVLMPPVELAVKEPTTQERLSVQPFSASSPAVSVSRNPLNETAIAEKSPSSLSALATSSTDGVALLNMDRLEAMRAIDEALLKESLTAYTEQIAQHFVLIEKHLASQDLEAFREVLHRLLGNAGEAGFYALHQFIRNRVYTQVANDQQWPAEEGWLETAKLLYSKTVAAVAQWQNESEHVGLNALPVPVYS